MAKFVYTENGGAHVLLEAEHGEEIPAEMAAVYAQMEAAWSLQSIADKLSELDTTLMRISDAMS